MVEKNPTEWKICKSQRSSSKPTQVFRGLSNPTLGIANDIERVPSKIHPRERQGLTHVRDSIKQRGALNRGRHISLI